MVQRGQVTDDYLSGVVPGGTYYNASYQWDKALQGTPSIASSYLQTIGNAEIRFDPPLLDSPKVWAGYDGSNNTESGIPFGIDTTGDGVYDLQLGESLPSTSLQLPDGTYTYPPTSVTAIYGIKTGWVDQSNYIGVTAIENGGKFLLDSSLVGAPDENKVTVISTDLVNNAMVVDGGEWFDTPRPDTTFTEYDFLGIPNEFDIPEGQAPQSTTVQGNLVYFAKENGVATTNGCYAGSTLTSSNDAREMIISSGNSASGPWIERYRGSVQNLVNNIGKVYCPDPYVLFSGLADTYIPRDSYIFSSSVNTYQDHVEYQTNGGQGEIVSVNTDDNTILLSDTGDRDNRWIAENKAATDFYVAGPSVVDEPLLTADVELKSTDFATTPENADTLKNIVWELNGAEQNAGVSNPYKPTLSTDTTYTVRVKHQGNDLEDSAWSTATTFTTGATRNLYTYYKERVELLESRLASIEADEVNDDATDTVLINTVADLIERIEQLEGGA